MKIEYVSERMKSIYESIENQEQFKMDDEYCLKLIRFFVRNCRYSDYNKIKVNSALGELLIGLKANKAVKLEAKRLGIIIA